MNATSTPQIVRSALPLFVGCAIALFPPIAHAADAWTAFTSRLVEQATNSGAKPAWPGGCSGVVVNRLNGDVTVKVVGFGLWRSSDRGATWRRIDGDTISGRDETGWATSVDQNAPERMASFSLDGTAGWTTDGRTWKKFTDLGRNWDFGSVDWSAAEPKTIIAAKHETTPPGEVYVTTDGGVTWNKLAICINGDRDRISMVGALDATTLIYSKGEGIQRSTDTGATWTKVSDANPQTRIPVLFQGAHYLGTATGLLVSRDKGSTWQTQGSAVNIWQGPFFGRDEKEISIVGKNGCFVTKDAGETWTRAVELKPKEGGFLFTANWFGCYSWDPVSQVFYASSMANPVFRCNASSVESQRRPNPESGLMRREFREVDTLFANPGQGWMSQQRSPRGEPRFPCSVVYIRFNWAEVEPEEGKFNWKLIDDVIAAWKPRGAAVSMRVMTCNAHSSGYYTSPKWLFDAGCKGHEYLVGGDDPTSGGKRIPRLEPDYSDPIYLAKHGAFLKALGERYDGRAEVEFLDIGSYGVWGEWHTKNPAPVAVRKQIVDLYLAAFRKTPLVFMSDDAEVLNYALAHGTGFRRDGVGSPWHEQNWIGTKKYAGVIRMADTWKRAPVVFEWFGDYSYLQSKQWPFDAAVNFMLSNHVTLINDNFGRVPPEAMPQLEKLARFAGARFVLRELAHPAAVSRGGSLRLDMKWANVGVGKLHRPYALRLFLLDSSGQPVVTTDAKSDPRAWLPGEHFVSETLSIPATMKPGDCTLAIALQNPADPKRPFRLAIEAPEKDGRYEVSRVRIE